MSGLAKAKFRENFKGKLPASMVLKRGPFPLLENWLEQKKISLLDFELSSYLLKRHPQIDSSALYFICHLIKATRFGHLCVKIDADGLYPTILDLEQGEEEGHFSLEEAAEWDQRVMVGSQHLPANLLAYLSNNEEVPEAPICHFGPLYYLQKFWYYETVLFRELQRIAKAKPRDVLNESQLKNHLQQLLEDKKLLKSQAEAILKACNSSILLLSGGPGTGKTYTAGYLIKTYWQSLTDQQKKHCQIVLAAPTGKAAAQLQSSIDRMTRDLSDFPSLKASTLHSLLGFERDDEATFIDAELILIDESSMVDVKIMSDLLKRVLDGTRLIFLGDPHQLSSVEAGNIFADLIQLSNEFSIENCSLEISQRSDMQSVLDLSDSIRQGNFEKLSKLLKIRDNGISWETLPEPKEFKEILGKMAENHYFPGPQNLSDLHQFCLLTPFRKGPYGSEAINQEIYQFLSKKKAPFSIPIIITENSYSHDLYNGEMGLLVSQEYALFPSRKNGEALRKIPTLFLPKYSYAYCLTVHKSQGSEFAQVALLLPEGSEKFGREVFYTGVTRAKKQIDLYTTEETIKKTILQKKMRQSGLSFKMSGK